MGESRFFQQLLGVLTEGSFVGDGHPGFFLGDDASLYQGRHTGTGTSVLDDPVQFSVVPLLVELAVREVSRARRQQHSAGAIACSSQAMTVDAGPLAFIEFLAFGDDVGCHGQRALCLPYFGPFSLRDTRLQWVGLGSGPSCRTQQGNGDYVAYCHDYTHTSHDSSLMMTTDITAKWLLRLHARGRKCRKT